jgi:hypothetical protein
MTCPKKAAAPPKKKVAAASTPKTLKKPATSASKKPQGKKGVQIEASDAGDQSDTATGEAEMVEAEKGSVDVAVE